MTTEIQAYAPQSNALEGTLHEQMEAFEQIAANLSVLGINGWGDMKRCKAACWLAHGGKMHPAVFIQNHYIMEVQGKLIVEPKMEFILGVLQSRVPGFVFKIEEETDERATVWMTDGRSEVRKTYDLEDAKRLGLYKRGGNMLTGGATREWCLKQAVKKAGRMIGAAAMMNLPAGLDGMEIQVQQAEQETPAKAVGAAIAKAEEKAKAQPKAEDVPYEEVPAGAQEPGEEPQEPPRIRLANLMTSRYGKLSKAVMAQKVNLIYNEMVKAETGVDPKVSFKAGEIGPVDAERMIAFLTKPKGDAPAPPAEEDAEEAPEPEEEQAPAAESGGRTGAEAFMEIMPTVERARKLFAPRNFLIESPPGEGRWWFLDTPTFSQIGEKAPILLQNAGEVVATVETIDALNRVLTEMCDAKERGR